MIDTRIFAELGQLDRADKLRIMQFLVIELEKEEGSLLKNSAQYPVWSPYNSYEAAGALLNLLNNDKPEQSHARYVEAPSTGSGQCLRAGRCATSPLQWTSMN